MCLGQDEGYRRRGAHNLDAPKNLGGGLSAQMDDVEGLLLCVTRCIRVETRSAEPSIARAVPLATDLQEAIRAKVKAKC